MSTKGKISIIIFLTAIIIGILIYPTLGLGKKTKFEVTKNPLTVYNNALKSGKPIYLEFYASW